MADTPLHMYPFQMRLDRLFDDDELFSSGLIPGGCVKDELQPGLITPYTGKYHESVGCIGAGAASTSTNAGIRTSDLL